MLRRWCNRLRATLGADGATVELLRPNRAGRWMAVAAEHVANATAADLCDVVTSFDEALKQLEAAGYELAGLHCEVAVADAWMIYEVIEGELHDRPQRVADDLAAAVLADTAGVSASELKTRWERQQGGRNLACALPLRAIQTLKGTLAQHKVTLGALRGEMVLAYNACRHALDGHACVLAVVRATGTQLALLVGTAFTALRFEPVPSSPPALLERARELIRSAGFDAEEGTAYLGDFGTTEEWPAPWVRTAATARRRGLRRWPARLDLDLSPTRPTVPATSWAMLAVGVVAILIGAAQFQTASGQHLRETRNLRSLESALNETIGGRASKPSAEDARTSRSSDAALADLQVPWARLLAALEAAASPEVALLALEPSAQRHEIRLLAEAKNGAAMLDFLDSLSQQKLTEVVLVSHQAQSQAPGAPIRFQARATWESR